MNPKQISPSGSQFSMAALKPHDSNDVASARAEISACDAIAEFCYHAHSVALENLARAGVKSGLIQRLSVRPSDGGLSVIDLSSEERQTVRDAAFAALRTIVPDYNASIPDFIGYAKKLDKRIAPEGTLSGETADDVVKDLVSMLSLARQTAKTSEQATLNYILLAGLLPVTKDLMPHHHEAVRFALYGVDSERADTLFRNHVW